MSGITFKRDKTNSREAWNLSQLKAKIRNLLEKEILNNIESILGEGLLVKNGNNSWIVRGISVSGNGFNSIVNSKGKEGNPTISLNIGTGATQVAARNHNHAADYEPIITSGTVNQFWRGDKTWADLLGTIAEEIMCYDGDVLTFDGEVLYYA